MIHLFGVLWKILPAFSGFFFAVSNPELSKEIKDGLTPIGYYLKDGVFGSLAYIGELI